MYSNCLDIPSPTVFLFKELLCMTIKNKSNIPSEAVMGLFTLAPVDFNFEPSCA